eukprot:Lithocolla_globosa_v1_NODE_4389_length_1447_cov_46.732759.p3 type:complete len:213 gc:universal NODE_4389_length_1447_cov_46.732759:512-1150(+)
MGLHRARPSLSLETIPGRTSISSPTLRTPIRILPPATPPFRLFTSEPGLFTSNDRITINLGTEEKSRTGMGIFLTMYSHTASMLYLSCAEMGTIGAWSATVPLTKSKICWYCSSAAGSRTRSILFWRIRMCLSCMISMAAKCSEVWGCGQVSFPAIKSSAASMTAAPFNMVAIRISWPGQSTNETCLKSSIFEPHPTTSQVGWSSFALPYER